MALNWDPVAHYKDDSVAKEYDRVRFSSRSGQVFNRMEKALVVKAMRTVVPSGLVADFPCGTGRLAEPLLEAGYHVRGYDVSPNMLEVAQGRLARFGDRFTTAVADAYAPDVKDSEKADAVLCARVLMHFPFEEQLKFFRGVARYSKGPVLFSQSFTSPYQRFRRSVKRAIGNQPSAGYPISSSQIGELLDAASLKEHSRFHLNPFISEAVMVVGVPK
jgi:2-polyprenyl-3-methyl-5-hydroxy-6-metoxy-1,4-benzoquinol methylase